MENKREQYYYSKKSWKKFLKLKARKKKLKTKRIGFLKHQLNIKKKAELEGTIYKRIKKINSFNTKKLLPKPDYPENIQYLLSIPEFFSKTKVNKNGNGHLFVPKCFSLIENYEKSFDFLKQLFVTLHENNIDSINIDYSECERIDVDASICMDLILAEFISYFNQCRRLGYNNIFKNGITPTNFENENIKKVLFSIGAYRNIKGFKVNYEDVLDLPVIVNDKNNLEVWSKSEVDLTKIVEYIKSCLTRLNRELTIDAEKEFYHVIGEIMSNSLEHSTMPNIFSIGFFQETHTEVEHYGIFNFSIFNFGDTIYQTFKNDDCLNKTAVKQMTDLSEDFTKKGFFKKAAFEEETLWTLYALQEGVTCKDKKRGNGSIRYIENFFKLKGNMDNDNISRLTIVSGNTRIMFDGTYNIINKVKTGENRKYKMITFNESGEINEEPNKKFVTFAHNFFPGTMISARILIKFDNTNENNNGK